MGTIKVDTVTGLADPNKVSLSSGATLQVDEIVNVSGDKDSGINLATNDNIKFNIAGSQKAVIDSSGNLLVGRASTISGGSNSASGAQIGSNGLIQAAVSGDTAIALQRLSDDGDVIQFRKDTTQVGSIGSLNSGRDLHVNSSGGILTLESNFNSTERQVVLGDSYFGVVTNDDNAVDLGRSSARYKDLYLGGGLFVGGTGSANHLDDYEEGTFTPAISGTGNSNNDNSGRYIKIGKMVTVSILVNDNGNNTFGSGSVEFTNMPFTSVSASAASGVSAVRHRFVTFPSNTTQLLCFVLQNTTTCRLEFSGSANFDTMVGTDVNNASSLAMQFSVTYEVA